MRKRGGRLLPSTRRALWILPLWITAVIWLWQWWFFAAPKSMLELYVPLSVALLYETTIMPSVLLFLALKAKVPAKRRPAKDSKVAIITPCVPAQESLDIIERQLIAMIAVKYPHDSWILDEGNNHDIRRLAKKYGVKYFSRKGKTKYSQSDYPFKTKTKAGNVNAWLDYVKRYNYEYFVQMDIDHEPMPDYLDKTLGHFKDKDVAWVQAPSIYKNMEYWTARGSAEQDMGMQGPLQMGFYAITQTPVIIGSHTTFRISALRGIGGFQATRAEDHLNTMALTANGWKGVFVPEAIAYGDGPETLNAYLSQQYAWARSMFQIFISHAWQHLRRMTFKQKLQFLFLQTWYPFSTITFFTLYFAPIIALVFNLHPVGVSLFDFATRIIPFLVASVALLWAVKPSMQPIGLKFSWRGILLHIIRWPVIGNALLGVLTNRQKPYQITPKGKFLRSIPTLKLYRPFLMLGGLSAAAMIFAAIKYDSKTASGQALFALYDAVIMLSVCLVDLNVRLRKISLKLRAFRLYWLRPVGGVALATFVAAFAFITSFVTPQQPLLALSSKQTLSDRQSPATLPASELHGKALNSELSSRRYALPNAEHTPDIGVYSPEASVPSSAPYIRHTFVDWRENWRLSQELVRTERDHATPLVTIEPKGDPNGARLLSDIVAGKYDDRLSTLIDTMSLSPNPVYVRFCHEMDLNDTYAWGGQDPATFIAAYRHVIDLARSKHATNLKWVWSPAGTPAAAAYYPGDSYVDIVGTTVLYDRYWSGGYVPNFHELQAVREWMFKYNKPVWIAEFGVGNDNPQIQREIIQNALENYRADGYGALVYLNIPDSNIGGIDYRLKKLSVLGQTFTPNEAVARLTQQAGSASSHSKVSTSQSKLNLPKPLRSHAAYKNQKIHPIDMKGMLLNALSENTSAHSHAGQQSLPPAFTVKPAQPFARKHDAKHTKPHVEKASKQSQPKPHFSPKLQQLFSPAKR